MGTAVVGIAVLIVVGLVVRGMVRDKKKGKSVSGCSGECGHCSGQCH